MDLALAHLLYGPATTRRTSNVFWSKKFTTPTSNPLPRRLVYTYTQQRPSSLAVASFTTTQPTTQENEIERETTKYHLLKAIQDTQRGLVTSPDQRSCIQEALLKVEGLDAGKAIELDKLDGTWRLSYTSASDVLVLFDAASRLPFFQVGQIFQKFECSQHEGGYVRNVVRWSVPNLLEEQEGATLIVSAKFSVISPRNIYLQFEEIAVQDIDISEELQAAIAPALLPRSFLTLQILQFIKTFKAQFPVTNTTGRRSVGGLYYLSYLDGNMLLGRAVGGGGVFVFTRAQPFL